jgi:hypothetical protein
MVRSKDNSYKTEKKERKRTMSLTIIGGNECMERKYEEICRGYGHKVKIFTKASGMIKKKIGSPDLVIMFTNTVSHKMVNSASKEAKRSGIPVQYLKSSSGSALTALLESYDA